MASSQSAWRRPTPAELQAAAGKTVPDVLTPGLTVLFCGINPGLYSAFTGHHFARPGNRFWPAIQRAGITERLLSADEDQTLVRYGCGITNLAARATATAAELTRSELRAGGERLIVLLEQFRPRALAVLGITAYRTAFDQPKSAQGRQPQSIGASEIWVLPNPSGLNAHYSLDDLAAIYREFWLTVTRTSGLLS
ncbi:G/U mismatch-specific DNA glycosylase [Candidatus Amarolinea aalborgensis]|uniref:G/U mismatch-specific DNA glycosylase n=1 Tax=Candidatus Amarolinea aalborgensis TaxID=2249329 RepID=UPI003BF977C6